MTTLMILWILLLILSIYTRGNVVAVFGLGYISALFWAALYFIITYNFTRK